MSNFVDFKTKLLDSYQHYIGPSGSGLSFKQGLGF